MTDQTLLSQSSTVAAGDRDLDSRLAERARAAAAQGATLLRNDGVLPLVPEADGALPRVALFGRTQRDWLAVGYGSGGDVNAPYITNLVDSLAETGAVELDRELASFYADACADDPADPGQEWGKWPTHYPEFALEDAAVAAAASRNDVAVLVIGRAAGEDREASLEGGSYYLTDAEETLLAQVTAAFERTVVVVDTGNAMDLSWTEEHRISAVLLAWLGGMEGARAIADVLTGAVEPGGRLTDTFARRYEDYPSAGHFGDPDANDYVEDVFVGYRYFETFAKDAVLFPFGAGLGYTTWSIEPVSVDPIGPDELRADALHRDAQDRVFARVRARATNTGHRPGSTVVQVYAEAPQGALTVPARVLVGFARTPILQPGESVEPLIEVMDRGVAVYDDGGATGHRSAWVLQPGEYRFHVGADVRAAERAGSIDQPELRVVEQLEEASAPRVEFDRIVVERGEDGAAKVGFAPVPLATVNLRERILDRLPAPIGADGASAGRAGASVWPGAAPADVRAADAEVAGAEAAGEVDAAGAGAELPDFAAVVDGRITLDDFVASLTPLELSQLSYGDITMDSPLGAAGNAGALGGVTEELRARGVPVAITTDGPSGIRLSAYASLLPCGTALACTWDPELLEELAALHAEEMAAKGSDILLSPGINIHRDPLCGRNFEYFSEDPLITGTMASAVVAGIQSTGRSACPKHFACNNQETNRIYTDSRVSERALREIYLRGFEICVRRAAPRTLMTSYNKINGVWGHYHYDLVTTILRREWGFDGAVVTDWWMRMAPDPDFSDVWDSAYRVRAQVDVLMPGSIEHGGTTREDAVYESYQRKDGITLGEMQRTARNVLRMLLRAIKGGAARIV